MVSKLNIRRALIAGLGVLVTVPAPAAAQVPATEYEGVQALGLAIRRLGHTKRVLMIGAHPDDESTQILSTLALGQGAQVAYLSLTRGEGGQNGIGPELQEGLGLLRSEELLSARRLDGARQYFTRAYDYGFSKSADEAFRHWPPDSVLADVVAVIRDFRPDIVVSVFTGTTRDGHGQHQVAGIMAREGFRAAGDPERFPGQIARGLRPHRTHRLYQSLWTRDVDADHSLSTGEMDPLLGLSHFQVAMASRSRHRSQDMGRILTPGPQSSEFSLVGGETHGNGEGGLFAGIDTLLSGIASSRGAAAAAAPLERYEAAISAAIERFDALRPARSVDELAATLAILEPLPASVGDPDLAFHIEQERAELEDALWRAAGVRLDGISADEAVVPGQEVDVELSLWNGGADPVCVERLEPVLPRGWTAEPLDAMPDAVAPGELVRRRFIVRVPLDAEHTEPYFLRQPRNGDLYSWRDTLDVGVPFGPPPVRAAARVRVAGAEIGALRDVSFQTVDKMQGEIRRPVRVVPAVSVLVEPALAILPVAEAGARAIPLSIRLRSEAPRGVRGVVLTDPPRGWRTDPAAVELEFGVPGEERVVEVSVLPPPGTAPGAHPIRISFLTGSDDPLGEGESYASGYRLIDYPHTNPRALYRPAAATVQALDVSVPAGLRVGYVAGPGDEVQAALRQLGIAVETLETETLASGDLSVYDVIVTGIRAYEVRPDLVTHNQRLLDYTRAGGTLIVQYNQYEYTRPGIAPYPVSMSRPHDRVTDETALVRLLEPRHPVLNWPNRIGDSDFEGWLHERGLYFLSEWDDRFTPLLETADPGSAPLRGGLLVAPYGEGTYVYTGLAFFRQLPAGVPGAYRLFANLLALGADR